MQPLGSNDYRSTLSLSHSSEIVLTQVFKSGRKYENSVVGATERIRRERESSYLPKMEGGVPDAPKLLLLGAYVVFTKGDVSLDEAG
jgi:hypothetical protein